MRMLFPSDDEPIDANWWAPLEALRPLVADNPRHRFFDVTDFMLMGKVARPKPRPDIFLYKHCYTHRYINLDDAGGAYRYVAPADIRRGVGRYLAESLTDALDALELWELPWMKPGLEAFRYGLSWDERWVLHPDAENAPSTEAEARKVAREVRRRRLRVV